ncbi:unnamed protein product [Bursaphelenchus xylophilus]|uniref:(pine wood nematode) hypothetical protein n=1 Tax=Bursaphelenchus xylophilus TaxID=6326 RepID=A0A1I7RIG2_BURXY|nr:unnamed protein product [Bursaphelenchus xylophilus]CAG9080792.1 unnamed protein product [Bursaphelenchus xylophilus]
MEPKERLRAQIKVLTERVDRHVELPNYGFGNPALSDFKIRAKDKTFYVSKYQLAVKSRVFAKMFEVDMNEKKEGVMKLDDDPDVVEAMLKYMYMYKKVEGIELARKVVQLAHRYEIDELKDQCELDMIRGLKEKDAEDILMFSWELKLSTLYLHCIDVLNNNFDGFDHDITFNCD